MSEPAKYSFLPYLRKGLTTFLTTQDNGSPVTARSSVTIKLNIQGNKEGNAFVDKDVELYSPAEVVGINPNAVLRAEPHDGSSDFLANYLPFIEFYEEDFPWAYNPFAPSGSDPDKKLRPWVTLAVLEAKEFKHITIPSPAMGVIEIQDPSASLPHPEQLWAWAHVHANHDFNQAQISNSIQSLDELLQTSPNKAVSRILCPRKLEKDTSYYAFLIPAYEHGRRAGLGISLDLNNHKSLTPSWDETDTTTLDIEFPIYYEWYFKTSEHGDFESLVEEIKPVVLEGDSMGFQKVDIQEPGDSEFYAITEPLDSPTVDLGGVLRTLDYEPSEDESWSVENIASGTYLELLREKLNYAYEIQKNRPNEDPIISPPLYGRWHAKKGKISADAEDDWFTRVNLDPRFRIFASAGAEVVKKNQEAFMALCWLQIDKVNEANKILRQLKLAERATVSTYERCFANQSDDNIVLLSTSLHDLILNQGLTVHAKIDESHIPNGIMSGAFRKLIRQNGSFANALGTSSLAFTADNLISNINNQVVIVANDYAAPSGAYYLSTSVQNTFNQTWLTAQPGRNNFYLTNPSLNFYQPGTGSLHTLVAHNFMTASVNTVDNLTMSYANPGQGTTLDLSGSATAIIAQLDPTLTIQTIASGTVRRVNNLGQPVLISSLNEIMATPKIELPMSGYLYDYSPDLLIPGINSIPQNSVSTLGIDQRYVEAYMLGLNHEMMRELLWRGYPTDQRGTVFSRFWSSPVSSFAEVSESDKARVIKNIHQWGDTTGLGGNFPANGSNPDSLIILVVRAELIKKYPNAFIYAHKAEFELDEQSEPDLTKKRKLSQQSEAVKLPIFITQMADLAFFGFNITPNAAKGNLSAALGDLEPGWFFVFKEMTGEINFGLDVGLDDPPFGNEYESWNDVDWVSIQEDFINTETNVSVDSLGQPNYVQQIIWGRNASEMAFITYRQPTMVAYHSINLIP